MKIRALALAAAFTAAFAWGQGVRPMDECAGKDDGAVCKTASGEAGKCTWLTARERDRLKIRSKADCRMEGKHAGSCHTCATEANMKAIAAAAPVNDPGGKPSAPKTK